MNRSHLYRKTGPTSDYFGRKVEVGDIFFCGNPPTLGRVIKILGKSIMMDVGADGHGVNVTMTLRDPSRGVIVSKLDGTEPLG